MNLSQVSDRGAMRAAALQLAVRLRYAAESWGGVKPFLARSLNGYPESGETGGPDIDWSTALGIKLLWATAAFFRQNHAAAVAYRFSGLRYLANRSHEAMYRRVLDRCLEAPQARRDMPVPEFDWRNRPVADFHEEFIKRPHPVVLRGLTTDCETMDSWTFDSFIERFGEEDVLLTNDEIDGLPGKLKAITSNELYLHNCEILFRRYPELTRDLPFDRLAGLSKNLRPTHMQLFLGRQGTGSPFHSAATWNWFFNIEGHKTWYFVDPRHGYLVYPANAMGQAAAFALCSFPDEYDEDFFPAFEHCPVFQVTLGPGDVLLNPPWWWHAVKNSSDTTVAVASRWIRDGQVGSNWRMTENDYDIDRMRSWLFFAGTNSWPFLHKILRNPSPVLTPDITVREKLGRFAHHQRRMATTPIFGMRHRF